jgi:glutamate-1-semialdehyde aminotransferase
VISKALGGGLMPIGACICRADIWTDDFGLLHSSTFANNNLACRVALGAIDLLMRDNAQMIHHVARALRFRKAADSTVDDPRSQAVTRKASWSVQVPANAGGDGSGARLPRERRVDRALELVPAQHP